MLRYIFIAAIAGSQIVAVPRQATAAVVPTNPATVDSSPDQEFSSIALTPDGETIVASGIFGIGATRRAIWTLPRPAITPAGTSTLTQISSIGSPFVASGVTVPQVSPDGTTVLYTNDSKEPGTFTIHTLPIGGEGAATPTGLFSGTGGSNQVFPGVSNFNAQYNASGDTIFFINNQAGFGGSVPVFDQEAWNFPNGNPDWDQIYSVPASGGTPVPVTSAADGDIDFDLWAVTGSSVVFAPDTPIDTPLQKGSQRRTLQTISTTGGLTSNIPFAAPAHNETFSITSQLEVSADGSTVFFIADYETPGKNELYSLPLSGTNSSTVPTRINDDLPFAGDITSFALAPNGAEVAYIAGQNTSGSREVFLKSLSDAGSNTSLRVSDPGFENGGRPDAGSGSGRGNILFSNDSSQILYLGDLATNAVTDLFSVDKTAKPGLTPSVYTYVGPDNGNFFTESNWEDADGNNPVPNSINPGDGISHALLIDGSSVAANGFGANVNIGSGGSIELVNDATLTLTNADDELGFLANSGFKISDTSTLITQHRVDFNGTQVLNGGSIINTSTDPEHDFRFLSLHDTVIDGVTIENENSDILFENSAVTINNATIDIDPDGLNGGDLRLRFQSRVELTDSTINVVDVDEAFGNDDDGIGNVLVLKGDSTLNAGGVLSGVQLVLEDSSTAVLGRVDGAVAQGATLVFSSFDAELQIPSDSSSIDIRDSIINGFTGLSYLEDPSAWNDPTWNGFDIIPLLTLQLSTIPGDFNGDGSVDAADYTLWRDNLGEPDSVLAAGSTVDGSGIVDSADYTTWETNFGAQAPATSLAANVPEPTSLLLAGLLSLVASCGRSRTKS